MPQQQQQQQQGVAKANQEASQRQIQQQQQQQQKGKAAAAPVVESTLSPDEFESALNAARTMLRKGDFEGAEYLFGQCCALLDAHEGEGLHTAYLTVDWAPCLNQLKRYEEASAVCERALRILEGQVLFFGGSLC